MRAVTAVQSACKPSGLTVLIALLLLAACQSQDSSKPQSQPAKKYELRGTVVEVLKDKRELRIKHEDIPGYMRGMTMNFPVRDDAALATLVPGDQITAELNVAAPGDYWLAKVHKTVAGKPAP